MSLRLACCALAPLAVACGARTSLLDAGSGGEGGGSSTSVTSASATTASGTGGDAGGGGGGGDLACDRLAWAGPPVEVAASAAIAAARAPRLVLLDQDHIALAFVTSGAGEAAMRHATLSPWGAWPPPVTTSEEGVVLLDPAAEVAVAPHDADRFAFAVAVDLSNLVVGTAQAGSWITIDGAVVRTVPDVRWIATQAEADERVVGYGPDEALFVDVLDRRVGGSATELGAIGCTAAPLASDATRTDDGVLVASANGTAFDDCMDPGAPEPPRIVQTVMVRPGGAIEPADWLDAGGRVDEVRVAARSGGAWLAWQTDADDYAQIVPVASAGGIVDAGLSFGLTPGHHLGIVGRGDGLGLVTAGTDPSRGGEVRVQLLDASFGHVAATTEPPPGAVRPRGAPAVLASADGRSVLIALETEPTAGGTSAPIVLLRADCAP